MRAVGLGVCVCVCVCVYLEEDNHALEERLKVEDVINAFGLLDVHEERHAKDGVDEHDKDQQETDVEERWH